MDGPPPPEEDFSVLSIADRLAHKNWKARVSAYESLIKSFQTSASDNDPVFKPYINNSDLLKKIATDANAVAQEKGVECLVSLVKFAGETAAKTRDAVVPALVEKCLGSTRAGTKNNALELILQYVEIENTGARVAENLLAGLSSKQPKTVAGCVLTLKELVRNFGLQVTPPPPVLKALPKIFAHSDKTVRAEGTGLTHVLYQYMGPGIEPWLADLKPVQVKELKEAFESMENDGKGKGTIKPERLTRVQAREAQTQVEGPEGVQEEAAPVDDIDPRAYAEEADIVPKIPKGFHSGLKSTQWKQRKEVLDDLSALLSSTPRIKEAPELGDLARALASCIAKDANINCVMVAAACLEEMAKGMMNGFARYREAVVPLMLERLKERKTNVTDSIGNALDAIFRTTTLPDILPDFEPALKSKNPQVKEGTLKFLGRCLSTSATPVAPPQVKPLAENLATLLEDGFEGARNEAAFCFGTLMKMVGERPLNAVMENMADMRKAKVKEAFEKATVKCKAGSAPVHPPPASVPVAKKTTSTKAPLAKPSNLKTTEDDPPIPKKQAGAEKLDSSLEDEPPKKPPGKVPARLLAKKGAVPPAAATPAAGASAAAPSTAPVTKKAPPTGGGKSKPPSPPAASGLDVFKYKHTPEDAENLAAELIPANIATDVGDANWKTRLAALEEMNSWVEREVETLDAEVVVRFLAKKGWGEKNFQVSAKIYGILGLLAQQNPLFGRSCCALCVSHLTEKLGDMKLKKPAGDTLFAFAEKTSLQFILGQAYEPLSKQKAPKVLADAVTWINTALTEFGVAGLTLRSLIDFLKAALGNSNAAVRTSATKTLVTVKVFVGPSIRDLLEDLNPQLLNTIITEFDKVEGTPAPEPTRTSADLANFTAISGGQSSGGAEPLDDLFPRVEIDSLLKGTTILADAKNDAWKTKKEALENLQAILDQGNNKRLKPSMGEIGQVLKARVVDTNKAVQTLALDIICRIATGMGKPFEKHARLFVAPVATVLADQKAPIRAAALQVLTAIASACGVESMVAGITTGLETQNPLQKGSLLHWLVDWFKEHEPSTSLDIANWATPIVASLDDRNGDVRKGAQAALPILIRCAGFDFVMQQTSGLKPASRATAVPLIQAARPTDIESAALPAKAVSKATTPIPRTSGTPPPPEPPSAPAPVTTAAQQPKAGTKIGGVRRKLPTTSSRPESRTDTLPETKSSTGLKRPAAVSLSTQPHATVTSTVPFTSNNTDAKRLRLAKEGQRWINEGGPTRKDLAELLQTQMEQYASKELVARLFSHDHNAVNDFIAGQSMIVDFYSNASGDESIEAVCLANLDLPLKYVSLRIHESQSNLVSKCLDVVEAVMDFLRSINYQMTDAEASCFVPTLVYKFGDAREPVRARVQRIFQALPKVYPYSRVFQILLDQGVKAKVAKTRQGTLDELANILRKSGMGACEPAKAFPLIATTISDKDPQVRKSALNVLSGAYTLVGEKVWSLVGTLSPKDKTQLEERLRRTPGPSSHDKPEQGATIPAVSRLGGGGLPRPASPSVAAVSRIARPASPAVVRSASPAPSTASRAESPVRTSRPATQSPVPTSPSGRGRGKTMLPSRLGRPRSNLPTISTNVPREPLYQEPPEPSPSTAYQELPVNQRLEHYDPTTPTEGPEEITLVISSILSSDPSRSVDALKKVQKILSLGPEAGPSNPQYRELAEHTEGLIESITLEMAHVFDRPEELVADDNFRLAKHLIQTLNNFCDHGVLAESLTVDILTSLLEELTLRLLETDDNSVKKIKDLSRFINMIILRLFATGRRMSIFRALFALLLQIVKPFPSNGTLPEAKEAKVAELVLKCVWKLARNIPQDLADAHLDPVELFPAIEHFLQSVPPNEWRARATNKVPCGDMPLRTIKVIIQHVVGHFGDDVYDFLSASFDDPSATIVYPYVYRILNSGSSRIPESSNRRNGHNTEPPTRSLSPVSSRPISPQESVSSRHRTSHQTSPSSSSVGNNVFSPATEEPDPDAQLLTIIGHISSETTGALHKEGITELHQFLKAYPHKRARVEKLLESTGAAFRKYINRALASRAAEDQEREVAVADTLSKLEYNSRENARATPPADVSPRRANSTVDSTEHQEKLSRLHDIFQYRSSTLSNGSSHGRTTPTTQRTSLEP